MTSPTSAAWDSLSTKPCRKCTTESRKSSRPRRTPSKQEVRTFPPTVCDQSFVRQVPISLIASRKNWRSAISLVAEFLSWCRFVQFFFEWRFEKKPFTVLGIFMKFKDYRKKFNLEIFFYLLCYLVVECILNIFPCLTMVILFFWSKNLDLFAYFVN